MAEPNMYLIANCLVTYRPLFKEFIAMTERVKSIVTPAKKSAGPATPSLTFNSNQVKDRRSSRGFHKLPGKITFANLGNTFDMKDTVVTTNTVMTDVEAGGTENEIQLRNMNSGTESGKGSFSTQTTPNQIHIRNDFYVKSEQK